MDMFRYSETATIIIAIFLLVIAVEQCSALVRRRTRVRTAFRRTTA
jgi:ABC-type phosphate/phosphonate transport system permease subunit